MATTKLRELASKLDKILDLDKKIAVLGDQLKKLETERKQLEEILIDALPKEDLDGLVGLRAVAKLDRQEVPTCEDWTAFYTYVRKNNAFDLLQKRLSVTACRERWEARKVVPGVTKFTRVRLVVHPRKTK